MTFALLDHIWQSTLFAGAAWLLTLAFRRNGAALRFWLWFAASIKFLVPFAALAALGSYLFRQYPAPLPQSILVLQPAAEKLSAPAKLLVAPQAETVDLVPLLLGLWLAGFVAILGIRLLRGLRLHAMTVAAQDLPVPAPVRIKTSASLLEPGLVGILKPVVLLPAGLMAWLSEPERDSILAHELSHLRRRDNVTAAIHMIVEALFWFYPPVWLIGSRMIAERERACDESVLASGHDPEVYAGGILKVCKFCIQSPLACVSGVSGADLGLRVRQIMTAEAARDIGAAKRLLLAGACLFTLALPIMAGFLDGPLTRQVRRDVLAVQARAGQAVAAMARGIGQEIGMAPVTQAPVTEVPVTQVTVAAPQRQVKVMAAPLILPEVELSSAPPILVPAESVPPPLQQPIAVAVLVPQPAPTLKAVVTALNPRGDGDPDAITCRAPQALPGSRLLGPRVCKNNRVWAQLWADGKEVSEDGTRVVVARTRQAMAGGCSNSALLGSFQSQNIFDGSILSGCR
ncbi:MAG TPA: M56 family metallopeptidase [Rhizomicrobium sp.]|nr:M56 family metallopeptidase [Rhizomicrobium sp.]